MALLFSKAGLELSGFCVCSASTVEITSVEILVLNENGLTRCLFCTLMSNEKIAPAHQQFTSN